MAFLRSLPSHGAIVERCVQLKQSGGEREREREKEKERKRKKEKEREDRLRKEKEGKIQSQLPSPTLMLMNDVCVSCRLMSSHVTCRSALILNCSIGKWWSRRRFHYVTHQFDRFIDHHRSMMSRSGRTWETFPPQHCCTSPLVLLFDFKSESNGSSAKMTGLWMGPLAIHSLNEGFNESGVAAYPCYGRWMKWFFSKSYCKWKNTGGSGSKTDRAPIYGRTCIADRRSDQLTIFSMRESCR